MSHLTNEIATQITTAASEGAKVVERVSASTKDSGRVKVGGVNIRYNSANASTKDAGRVRVGGVNIRF